MKKLITLISVICVHLILSHAVLASCWVKTDDTSETSYTLPEIIVSANLHDAYWANCGYYSGDVEGYGYAVKFVTEDYCIAEPGDCNNEYIIPTNGIEQNGNGLSEITLTSPLVLSYTSNNILMGNTQNMDVYSLPLINLSQAFTHNEGEITANAFECSGNKTLGLRNIIFQTGTSSVQGPSEDQVNENLTDSGFNCLDEEYNVYWCGGEVIENPEDVGGSQDDKVDWCREDFDRDGTDNDEDCDDEDPDIQEPSDEIPGNDVDEDCDGILGDCEITLTPDSDEVYAGESTSFTVDYNTTDYDGSATLTITGEDSTMTVSGDLELESGDSSEITIETSEDTPAGEYVLTILAVTVYADGEPVAVNLQENSLSSDRGQIATDAYASWHPAMQGSYTCGELTFTLTVLEQGEEICDDDIDNDGDGLVDEDCDEPCTDDDSDGFCEEDDDCDDSDPEVNPDAEEICDGIDNDCDGDVDADTCEEVCTDDDGDGFCAEEDDCDDTDASINPDATEVCDGVDNDCNGLVDDVDADGDGYYECSNDCDDTDPNVNPGAEEICANGIDDNCDGEVDEMPIWYQDNDEDGYGDEDSPGYEACEQPSDDFVDNNYDCNDANRAINPGAFEICDGIDNDCDGEVDEGLLACAESPGVDPFGADLEGGACGLVQATQSNNKAVYWILILFMFVPIFTRRLSLVAHKLQ